MDSPHGGVALPSSEMEAKKFGVENTQSGLIESIDFLTCTLILEALNGCHNSRPFPGIVYPKVVKFGLVQIEEVLQFFVAVQDENRDVVLVIQKVVVI